MNPLVRNAIIDEIWEEIREHKAVEIKSVDDHGTSVVYWFSTDGRPIRAYIEVHNDGSLACSSLGGVLYPLRDLDVFVETMVRMVQSWD